MLAEPGGGIGRDWSGRRANAALAAAANPSFNVGRLGRNITASGTSAPVAAPLGANSLTTTSVSLWFKGAAGATPAFARLIEKGNNTDWAVCLNDGAINNTIFIQTANGANRVSFGGAVLDGNWHHCVVTFTFVSAGNTAVSVYTDGVFTNSATLTTGAPVDSGTGTIAFGYHPTSGAFNFVGGLMNVRIYNRILSALEARALYVNPFVGVASLSSRGRLPLGVVTLGAFQADSFENDAFQTVAGPPPVGVVSVNRLMLLGVGA